MPKNIRELVSFDRCICMLCEYAATKLYASTKRIVLRLCDFANANGLTVAAAQLAIVSAVQGIVTH